MELETLQKYRVIVSGVVIFVSFVPLTLTAFTVSAFKDRLSLADGVMYMLLVVVAGALYNVIGLRSRVLAKPLMEVRNNIKNRLIAICRSDPYIASHESWLHEDHRLVDGAFYKLVDSDPTLTKKSENVYFNGLLWSSVADLALIALIAAASYLIALFFVTRTHYLVVAAPTGYESIL